MLSIKHGLCTITIAIACSSRAPSKPDTAKLYNEHINIVHDENSQSADAKNNHALQGCVIPQMKKVVVLDFTTSEYKQDPSQEITELFRKEVKEHRLLLSGYRSLALDQQIGSQCHADPADDGACMSSIARKIGADWVVWGNVRVIDQAISANVQLVNSAGSFVRTTAFITPKAELPASVHAAWRRLVSP